MEAKAIIGRENQLRRMQEYYEKMLQSESRLCFVTGVAGSGKTFLVDHFLGTCIDPNHVVVARGACNMHASKAEAYFPFLEIFKSLLATMSQHDQSTKRTSETMKNLGKGFVDILIDQAPDLIGGLIPGGSIVISSIKKIYEHSNSSEKLNEILNKKVGVEGGIDTKKIQFQFAQMLRAVSQISPIVLSLDDLHWSDDESLDLLCYLARQLSDCRLMIVCTYRRNDLMIGRNERHAFVSMTNELKRYFGDIWIDLDKIDERDAMQFTRKLLAGRENTFDEEFHQSFFKHTNGHPLFSVELIRHLIENGNIRKNDEGLWQVCGDLDWSRLPAKVEGIIEERIGRLDDELRDIMNISSVEGGTFSVPVIARVLDIPEKKLLKLLEGELAHKHQLIAEEDTKKVGDAWMTHYKFIHILFQQHLYHAMSTRERIIAHSDIAEALEGIYGDDNDEVSAILAYHYDQGQNAEKALPFYLRAGKRASSICGYTQAITLFRRALNLIEMARGKYADIELELKIQYGIALKALKGWDDKEVLEVLLEAESIAEKLGKSSELGPALFGLWGGYLIKLDLEKATLIAEKMMQIGSRAQDDILIMQAHLALSDNLFWLGRFQEGLAHIQSYYVLCNCERQEKIIAQYGQDSSMFADMYEMLHYCMLGEYASAQERLSKMDGVVKRSKHPYSQAIGLVALAWCAFQLQKIDEMGAYAKTLVEVSNQNGYNYYLGYGHLFSAVYSSFSQGHHDIGLASLEKAAALICGTSQDWLYRSLFGIIRIEILILKGMHPEAIAEARALHASSEQKQDLCYIPEILRLESLAHHSNGNLEEANRWIDEAIESAKTMGSVIFTERSLKQKSSYAPTKEKP
jgi:tetratricopeptide (TPR) repeat protein